MKTTLSFANEYTGNITRHLRWLFSFTSAHFLVSRSSIQLIGANGFPTSRVALCFFRLAGNPDAGAAAAARSTSMSLLLPTKQKNRTFQRLVVVDGDCGLLFRLCRWSPNTTQALFSAKEGCRVTKKHSAAWEEQGKPTESETRENNTQ